MAFFKRKKVLLDKKFQLSISFKAVILPLVTILIIGSMLLYFANKNTKYTNAIVANQDRIMDVFLSTPALQSDNTIIQTGQETFKNNIGMLEEIRKNSEFVLYFIVVMLVVQSLIIFAIFIFITHRISGPIFVMARYLREVREGKVPTVRSLRKKDELKEFFGELQETVDYLKKK
ncbi:MAG: hypothetical protein MUC95_01315 [Spirochaetes bacterium]|nr:hypothetical protein [Spirochaetota bacterium]